MTSHGKLNIYEHLSLSITYKDMQYRHDVQSDAFLLNPSNFAFVKFQLCGAVGLTIPPNRLNFVVCLCYHSNIVARLYR